jgi:hypothetical protein
LRANSTTRRNSLSLASSPFWTQVKGLAGSIRVAALLFLPDAFARSPRARGTRRPLRLQH